MRLKNETNSEVNSGKFLEEKFRKCGHLWKCCASKLQRNTLFGHMVNITGLPKGACIATRSS